MIATFALSVIAGVFIGIFSGLLGLGGGTMMVPLFRLVYGLSAVVSTATSLFTIIPTSIAGAVSHARNKTNVPKLGIALGIGGALTSPIGVHLAQLSPSWAIMTGTAIVIAYSATTMLRKALAIPKSPRAAGKAAGKAGEGAGAPLAEEAGQTAAGASVPSRKAEEAATFDPRSLGARELSMAALIGAVAGVASGYVGLGGGFLMVPLMLSVLHMPMKLASGTSLIAIIILALPASVAQVLLGNVEFLVGIAVALGSIPGAILGAHLTTRVPERSLRLLFAAFLGLASILLVVKETGLLG